MGITNIIKASSIAILEFGARPREVKRLIENNTSFFLKENIKFVTMSKHADVILIYPPISNKMASFLRKNYDDMSNPKWVITYSHSELEENQATYATISNLNRILPIDIKIIKNKHDCKLIDAFKELKQRIRNAD